jgi:hypothetical protein
MVHNGENTGADRRDVDAAGEPKSNAPTITESGGWLVEEEEEKEPTLVTRTEQVLRRVQDKAQERADNILQILKSSRPPIAPPRP